MAHILAASATISQFSVTHWCLFWMTLKELRQMMRTKERAHSDARF